MSLTIGSMLEGDLRALKTLVQAQTNAWFELHPSFCYADCTAAMAQAQEDFGPPLGEGAFRSTYDIGGGLVLKIPQEPDPSVNLMEAVARETMPELPLADCVMVEYKGTPALLMEKVRIANPEAEYDSPYFPENTDLSLPAWTQIDKQQVGYASDGKLKAFDYGLWHDLEHIMRTDHGQA